MPIQSTKELKQEARLRLDSAPGDPRKMVFLHALIYAALSLGAVLISEFLSARIDRASGLGGLETRTRLGSLQWIVSVIPSIFLIFWTMGYTYSILQAVRRHSTGLNTLREGFYRFGPVLRFTLLQYGFFLAVGMAGFVPAMLIFSATPMGTHTYEIVAQGMENGLVSAAGEMTPELEQAVVNAVQPMVLVYLIVAMLLIWILSYPFRMAPFVLMDKEKTGAFSACAQSIQMMRGRRKNLLKLDLSFWWYYVLLGLSQSLIYLDLLLPMFGVSLPISPRAANLVAFGLSLAGMVAISVLAKNKVYSCYALFYEEVSETPAPAPEEKPVQMPTKNPWNYQ